MELGQESCKQVRNSKDELIGVLGLDEGCPMSLRHRHEFEFMRRKLFSPLDIISLAREKHDEYLREGSNISWAKFSDDIMRKGLHEKFTQVKELKKWLLSTGDAALGQLEDIYRPALCLVKNSNHKNVICESEKMTYYDIAHPENWTKYKLNGIGDILMDIRAELKNLIFLIFLK
jgi:predicted NAD-dependent protein-ADP-ribosyltransferase YbiA (DUF1768 family)